MTHSMAALPTSTSQPSEAGRHLVGGAIPTSMLTDADRRRMYALLGTYFEGTDPAGFETDLGEKQSVILLRDGRSGLIQGFSTLMRLDCRVDGQDVAAFFSGDTIVDREYWGESVLARVWGQAVFEAADRLQVERPGLQVYWFLICSGYKTWRFLPVFFREFYPSAAAPTPSRMKRILDTLASGKFGDQYLPELGIVRLRRATPLRRGVAEITDERLRDPHVAFFARMNPGHDRGDELACLAELSRSNLTRAAARLMARPAVA